MSDNHESPAEASRPVRPIKGSPEDAPPREDQRAEKFDRQSSSQTSHRSDAGLARRASAALDPPHQHISSRFVIFEVSAKIGRHFWRHPAVRLDAEDWEQLPARFGADPAHQAEWGDLFAALRRAVDTELTSRQRAVFVAIVLNDVPLDTLVMHLGSSRNAIYQVLFDARRKLRAALAANGYLPPGDLVRGS